MRDLKLQKQLDEMTDEEKYERTSMERFADRGTLICLGKGCYLTYNEYPHKSRGDRQYVMWLDSEGLQKNQMNNAFMDMFQIAYQMFPHMNITLHANNKKSVKMRPHLHIYN